MPSELSDSRLANIGARLIRDDWAGFADRFRIVTRRAQLRFAERDKAGMASDHVERLDLYSNAGNHAAEAVKAMLGERIEDRSIWASMKAVYSGLIQERPDWELAETFFNSVTRKIFVTVGVDPRVEFVDTDFAHPPHEPEGDIFATHGLSAGVPGLVRSVVEGAAFAGDFADLDRDCRAVAQVIEDRVRKQGLGAVTGAEVADMVFYRGAGAYLVGRLLTGDRRLPFALALLNEPGGIVIDAMMTTEKELSILFSFTRSYFHVDHDRPHALVEFLSDLLPRKRRAEIYISIGHHKHGKTELYRDLRAHMTTTGDRFEFAPGTRGLVMEVFTLPGFDVVFKVIRDRFGAPKQITREHVKSRYRLVFKHDRAGRLVDAQEYEHLEFPIDRFDPALLQELLSECSRTVRIRDGRVALDHSYVERRVSPLDVHLQAGLDVEAAVLDFGQAIRDLAASGIFPGDMLLKNFGVTRHGRVVFYDYDELTTLEECTFRKKPVSSSYDDELSEAAWFPMGPGDVFPEEFATFLGLDGRLRDLFFAKHADLFEAATWRKWQASIRAGEIIDIYPYTEAARLDLTR